MPDWAKCLIKYLYGITNYPHVVPKVPQRGKPFIHYLYLFYLHLIIQHEDICSKNRNVSLAQIKLHLTCYSVIRDGFFLSLFRCPDWILCEEPPSSVLTGSLELMQI